MKGGKGYAVTSNYNLTIILVIKGYVTKSESLQNMKFSA